MSFETKNLKITGRLEMLSKDMAVHLAAEPNPIVPLARKLKQFLGVETDEVSIDKTLRRSVFIKL